MTDPSPPTVVVDAIVYPDPDGSSAALVDALDPAPRAVNAFERYFDPSDWARAMNNPAIALPRLTPATLSIG